jgi:DNA-binding response OmpR family regulator
MVGAIEKKLLAAGFLVHSPLTGAEGRRLIRDLRPDIIVMTIHLPDDDGFDICRDVRRESQVPIIMLTGRAEEVDRIVGLELGADDYITKPFSLGELVARIKAVLRRASMPPYRPRRTPANSKAWEDTSA